MARVSVLMPFHRERFLRESLESLAGQIFDDWHLVAVSDAAPGEARRLVTEIAGDRATVLHSDEPCGHIVGELLNRGIDHCCGEWVARWDADDLYHPERLARQVGFLGEHPEVDLLGTCGDVIDEAGATYAHWTRPSDHEGCLAYFRHNDWASPFGHASVVMRTSAILAMGGYCNRYPPLEDVPTFYAMLHQHGYRGANLPEELYSYRTHADQGCSARGDWVRDAARRFWADVDAGTFSWPQV